MIASKSSVLHLNERDFDSTATRGVCLVGFWAPWCARCRMQEPVLDEVAVALQGKATVVKVNVDDSPRLAAKFRIEAIPLLVILKDGMEIARLVGPQSRQTLLDAVEQALRTTL